MFRKLKRYWADPYWALGCDLIKKHPKWMSDEFYIRTLWRMVMGYKLDLKNPETFNEKLQWLKLYDHNPLYTTLVDKLRVKDWVAEKIGAQYVIPTLAVWEKAEDIDISNLPNQFVLKCNHDSGSVVICKDKSSFDLNSAREKLGKALKHNFYWDAREWAYKHVKPCVFAEKFLENPICGELPDYKFFTFNGVVKALYIATDRANPDVETKFDFFDMNFEHIDVTNEHPNATIYPSKPKCFEEMVTLSEVISTSIPQVRCDFYEVNGQVYFGELTFYHMAGMTPFTPSSYDRYLGSFINLPNRK